MERTSSSIRLVRVRNRGGVGSSGSSSVLGSSDLGLSEKVKVERRGRGRARGQRRLFSRVASSEIRSKNSPSEELVAVRLLSVLVVVAGKLILELIHADWEKRNETREKQVSDEVRRLDSRT